MDAAGRLFVCLCPNVTKKTFSQKGCFAEPLKKGWGCFGQSRRLVGFDRCTALNEHKVVVSLFACCVAVVDMDYNIESCLFSARRHYLS